MFLSEQFRIFDNIVVEIMGVSGSFILQKKPIFATLVLSLNNIVRQKNLRNNDGQKMLEMWI